MSGFKDELGRALSERSAGDTVERRGLTRETVLRLNDLAGSPVDYEEPGEVLVDVDGYPADVAESTRTSAYMTTLMISRAEADRLGLTPEEIPNVRVI